MGMILGIVIGFIGGGLATLFIAIVNIADAMDNREED